MELAIAFAIAIIVMLIIYLFGRAISPTPPKSKDKLMPYACGESFPPARSPVRLLLFNFAALFMVLDIIALFLAFTIGIPPVYKPQLISLILVYGVILAIAIHFLGRR